MKKLLVVITLIEEMLGTAPANPELYEEFIAKKCGSGVNQDEMDSLPSVQEEMEKGTTVFHRENGVPFIYDYVIKGFFKDACSMINRFCDKKDKLTAHKKVIDGLIFPQPRKILINIPEDKDARIVTREGTTGKEIKPKDLGVCMRPLRGQTAQGERVTLARSEAVPAGSTMGFSVVMLDPNLAHHVMTWLEYGELRGLGQWRNSGKGRFTFTAQEV